MTGAPFYIVDPSLKDFRGHHFMLTGLASQSARAAGLNPIWLVSAEAAPAAFPEGAEIRPWFSSGVYDAYKDAHQQPSLLRRALAKLGAMTLSPAPADPAEPLQKDLRRALSELGGDQGARFFIHTADGAVYRALAALADWMEEKNAGPLHICTPYDPVGVMPNKGGEGAVGQAIKKLKSNGLIGKRIFLYGENEFLAKHLAKLWDAPVRPLNIPIQVKSSDAARPAFRQRFGLSDDMFVAASLGSARLEKGFDLFPAIIAAYKKLNGPPVHFLLHAAPQIIGRHPDIDKTMAQLQSEHGDMATLLSEPLSRKDYEGLLAACDAVLLPYDPESYRVRGSGPAVEALAAGKIMIASKGSYPARLIAGGAGETAASPEDFAHALAKIARAPEAYRMSALAAGDQYSRDNEITDYVKKMLATEAQTAS